MRKPKYRKFLVPVLYVVMAEDADVAEFKFALEQAGQQLFRDTLPEGSVPPVPRWLIGSTICKAKRLTRWRDWLLRRFKLFVC
jgi:hypothetical protein